MTKLTENNIEYEVEYDGWKNTWYSTTYFCNGKISRLSGPAIEYHTGEKEWWLNGIRMNVSSQDEFNRHLQLKAFW